MPNKSNVTDLSFESIGESCDTPKFLINVIYDQNGHSQNSPVYKPNLTSVFNASKPFQPWNETNLFESSFHPHDQTLDTSRYTLLKGQRLITRYFKKKLKTKVKPIEEQTSPSEPIDILRETIQRFLAPFRRMQFTYRHRHFYLLNLYNCLITIDIYLNLLVCHKMNGVHVEKRPCIDEPSLPESETVVDLENVAPDEKRVRKTPLLADTKEETDEKDFGKMIIICACRSECVKTFFFTFSVCSKLHGTR